MHTRHQSHSRGPILSSILLVVVTAAIVFPGCGGKKFTSVWNDRAITVDGDYSDWGGSLPYLDRQSMYLGIRNDGDNLYILLKTVDLRAQMLVLRTGLTLRIGPDRKGASLLEIRYPIGFDRLGMPFAVSQPLREFTAEQRGRLVSSLADMDIRGSEHEDWKRIADTDSSSVRIAVRDTSEVVVYEMKVPLRSGPGRQWAVGAAPGERIVLEAVTGEAGTDSLAIRDDKWKQPDTTGLILNKGRTEPPQRQERPDRIDRMAETVEFRAVVDLAANPSGIR
jgi:hypothetical protein